MGDGAMARCGLIWCVLGGSVLALLVLVWLCWRCWPSIPLFATALLEVLLALLLGAGHGQKINKIKDLASGQYNDTMKALKAHTGQRPKRQNRAIQSGNPTARSRNFNVINGLRELLHLSDGQEHQQAKQGKAPERSKQSTSKGKHQSKSTKGKHHRQRSKGKHRVRNHKRNNKIAPDQETSCNVQKTMLQCKPCKQHRSKQGIEESKPQASNKTSQYHAKTVLQCRSCNEAYEVEQVVSDDTGCSKPKQTWEGTLGKFPDTSKYATMQTILSLRA